MRRLGPYRILSLIAQGGMGAVYEAIHDGLGRVVALKTMLPSAAHNREDVQRFAREAQAASRLSHRNLVPIFDVGEAEGIRYLAMELVRGQTLHERIRQSGKLEEGQALAVMIGVSEGLEHAHKSGVLHRDLKPANVILEADGTPRLTDFGVAKAAGASRLTASGTALGTPNYMSPEQAMGMNQELDVRTDVWGIGAILYECVTGQPPFNEGSHVTTMQAVVNQALVPPRAVTPDVSRDVEAIVLKCLAKDREERYATTTELLVDLRACLAGRTIRARVPGVLQRTARRVHRNAAIAALGVLALGLLLTLGVVALGEKRPELAIPTASGQGAATWLARRSEALAAAPAERERLAALLAELEPAGLARLGPEDRAALEAPPLRAALATLRAQAAVRVAQASDGGLARAPIPLLVGAALADPRGPWGRRARLALVTRLDGRKDAPARDLAAAELRSLSAVADDLSGEVATRLTRRLAEQARWDEALAAAPQDHPLRPLLAGLTPARRLPAADLTGLGGGDTVLLARGQEVLSWSARSGEERSLGRVAAPPRQLGVAGGVPHAIAVTTAGLILQRLGPGAEPQRLEHRGDAPTLYEGGDFDGDGEPDAVGVLWDQAADSVVLPGAAGHPPPWRLFAEAREATQWMVGSVLAADLDGDQKDELILGSSELCAPSRRGVMVRRLDPARSAFVAQATLPLLAHVTDLAAVPLGPGKTGVLAVVDWQFGREAHLLDKKPGRERPWEGRDGVYLLELAGKELTIRARWSYGSDEPATRASAAAVDGIQAWVMRAGGETWVVRAGRLADGPRLELLPLARLLAGESGEPVTLDLADLPPAPPEVRDLDGDGDDELLWGGTLLGLGGAVEPAAPPPEPGRATDAVRLARLAHLAGAGEPLAELARQFEAERPEAASAARLAGAEVPLEQAEAVRAQALAFLGRGLLEPGRRAWSESERLLELAAVAAQDLAARQDEQVLPVERALAALLAADAWSRVGQGRRALAALERAPLQELAPTLRTRVEQVRAAREARERVEQLRLDLTGPGELPLAPLDALTSRTGRGGLQVELRGRRPGGAVVGVDLPPASPLVLAATFRSLGPAWRARFRVGVFLGPGPEGFTGVEVTPWSAFADRTRLELIVDGVPAGVGGFLPEHRTRVALRLELEPGPEGLLARLLVREGDGGGLLLAGERRLLARPCGGRVQLGALSVPDASDLEEHGQGSVGVVLLESLGLESTPAPRLLPHAPLAAAQVALCRGDPAEALTLLDRAAADARDTPELTAQVLRYRAFAAGRAGSKDAHQDLVKAAEADPPGTFAALEEWAEALLFGPPADRATVARALDAFAASPDTLFQLFAVALGGHRAETEGEPPADSSPRGRALVQALRLLKGGDRSSLPLAFVAEPLGEEERASLQAAPPPDARQQQRQLIMLVSDQPDDPQGWLVFGQLSLASNRLRRAERCFQRGAELGGPLRADCLLGASMAQLRRFLLDDAIDTLTQAVDQGLPRATFEAWVRTAEAIPALSGVRQDPRLDELRRRVQ